MAERHDQCQKKHPCFSNGFRMRLRLVSCKTLYVEKGPRARKLFALRWLYLVGCALITRREEFRTGYIVKWMPVTSSRSSVLPHWQRRPQCGGFTLDRRREFNGRRAVPSTDGLFLTEQLVSFKTTCIGGNVRCSQQVRRLTAPRQRVACRTIQ